VKKSISASKGENYSDATNYSFFPVNMSEFLRDFKVRFGKKILCNSVII